MPGPGKIVERVQIQPAFDPVDGDGGIATGDYVRMKDAKRILAVVQFADGTVGMGDVTVTLFQAQDAAGTGAKDLTILETGRIYTKQNATSTANIGVWTERVQATALNSFTDAASAEDAGIWAFDIRETDFDTDNAFDYLRMDVLADGGAAKLISGVYYVELNENNQPDKMPDLTT